jgi:hypothetical protein
MGKSPTIGSFSEQMLQRIAGEYREMPGLRLTAAQAQRLFHLDSKACSEVLSELVQRKVLSCEADGRYTRMDEGATVFPIRRMAKAQLDSSAPVLRARAPRR